jgi:hypothetical protein
MSAVGTAEYPSGFIGQEPSAVSSGTELPDSRKSQQLNCWANIVCPYGTKRRPLMKVNN